MSPAAPSSLLLACSLAFTPLFTGERKGRGPVRIPALGVPTFPPKAAPYSYLPACIPPCSIPACVLPTFGDSSLARCLLSVASKKKEQPTDCGY